MFGLETEALLRFLKNKVHFQDARGGIDCFVVHRWFETNISPIVIAPLEERKRRTGPLGTPRINEMG